MIYLISSVVLYFVSRLIPVIDGILSARSGRTKQNRWAAAVAYAADFSAFGLLAYTVYLIGDFANTLAVLIVRIMNSV